MTRKITLQDIGRKLGLSTTTISLALRDHPRISAGTKLKVRRLIDQVKYEPDRVARALVMGKSSLLGVIVPNSTDPYYAEVFKGIEDGARLAGYHVLLSNGSYDMDAYGRRVKEMMSLRVDGIIAAPPFLRERPVLQGFWKDLRDSNFPMVLVNRYLRPAIFHQISADYISGVQMIIEMLASMGHQRVAYISGQPAILPIRQRLAAFRRFAHKATFEEDSALFEVGELTVSGGYEACKRLWSRAHDKPTAIVSLSDTVGVGAMRYLHEQSVDVPSDVSLVSFDGTVLSQFTNPSLTTVATPIYEIGMEAFQLISGALQNKYAAPQSLLLPVKLVIRESVGLRRRETPPNPVGTPTLTRLAH